MKKTIIFLFIISLIFICNNKQEIIIPKESIRFRLIANSNDIQDQALKLNIKTKLIKSIIPAIEKSKTITESRNNINSSIDLIKEELNKYDIPYNISFGNNYFPQKMYKDVIYPEGNYESLVITLGNGLGDNFWCVLYPPLCLVEENKNQNIEYKSLVKEIITKHKP